MSAGRRSSFYRYLVVTITVVASSVVSHSIDDANQENGSGRSVCLNNETEDCFVSWPALNSFDAKIKEFQAYDVLEQLLADDYDAMDPVVLPNSVSALKSRGAHRCWHKHSTFLDHLLGVHNILRLWGQGPTIGRLGLFHSAYSNSYVNLALYDPLTERQTMQSLIGIEAESLVHMFCIVDRQQVVVNTLLRQGFIPKEGLFVPHLRNPEERVYLSAETLRMLLVFTMADTADQYFGWQDQLFGGGGTDGSMIVPGEDRTDRHDSTAIWPGVSKPGLWMSYVSDLGKVVRTFDSKWRAGEDNANSLGGALDVPPVFDNCSQTLTVGDEAEARDLYWNVVSNNVLTGEEDRSKTIASLQECCRKNPWAFEPLVVLSQIFLHGNQFERAAEAATKALSLQQLWGTAWDKRLSFGAWVSWTRVMHQRALERQPWPVNSWEVNNFGLVK